MASASDGGRSPKASPEARPGDAAAEAPERGRSAPLPKPLLSTDPQPPAAAKRSALHKPRPAEGGGGGGGYDFSGSYDQTRRVRFKFGVHSLAVEATLAKLFESLTMECR